MIDDYRLAQAGSPRSGAIPNTDIAETLIWLFFFFSDYSALFHLF
jgi:hypothetical protein